MGGTFEWAPCQGGLGSNVPSWSSIPIPLSIVPDSASPLQGEGELLGGGGGGGYWDLSSPLANWTLMSIWASDACINAVWIFCGFIAVDGCGLDLLSSSISSIIKYMNTLVPNWIGLTAPMSSASILPPQCLVTCTHLYGSPVQWCLYHYVIHLVLGQLVCFVISVEILRKVFLLR